MRTIWKYQLQVKGESEIEIPSRAKFLSLQVQNDLPCLWFQVNSDFTKVKRKVAIVGTGHPLPGSLVNMNFIGTFQLYGGSFVGHVFLEN